MGMVYLSGAGLPRLSWKTLNKCLSVCVCLFSMSKLFQSTLLDQHSDCANCSSFLNSLLFFLSSTVTHISIWLFVCKFCLKKYGGDGEGGHWLVRMEWRPAGWSVCLPLLISPCTIKSRSSLLALCHPGGPGKRAVKRLWCGSVYLRHAGCTGMYQATLYTCDCSTSSGIFQCTGWNLYIWWQNLGYTNWETRSGYLSLRHLNCWLTLSTAIEGWACHWYVSCFISLLSWTVSY